MSNALGVSSLGGISPLAAAVIVKSDGAEDIKDSALEVAQLRYVRKTAQFALDTFGGNSQAVPTSSNNPSSNNDNLALANKALEAQRKQAVFGLAIEKINETGSYIDTKI